MDDKYHRGDNCKYQSSVQLPHERQRGGQWAAQILFCNFGEFQTEGRFWFCMLR